MLQRSKKSLLTTQTTGRYYTPPTPPKKTTTMCESDNSPAPPWAPSPKTTHDDIVGDTVPSSTQYSTVAGKSPNYINGGKSFAGKIIDLHAGGFSSNPGVPEEFLP